VSDYRLAEDGDLVSAIANGHEAAVGVLYDRYQRQCFGFALRILGAESDAEEAVQETFVRVWRNARHYDETKAGVGSWVLSITRNLCIDELRRRRRRVPEKMRTEDQPDVPASDHTEDEAVRGVMGEQVRASLQALTGDQRSAIELVYFHGLSSSEVGRILGVPAPTVRSRLRLGLQKLSEVLKARGLVSVD
jgi:RNA polymerase sigma-70 factor (ECF subfamily)